MRYPLPRVFPPQNVFRRTPAPRRRAGAGGDGLPRPDTWPRASARRRLSAVAESPDVGRRHRPPGLVSAADSLRRLRADLSEQMAPPDPLDHGRAADLADAGQGVAARRDRRA